LRREASNDLQRALALPLVSIRRSPHEMRTT